MTIQQAADFLRGHDGYLILTHVRPDGDTVGCAAGLCHALRQMGKTAFVLPNPEITPLFSPYLDGLLAPETFSPDTVVCVDIAAPGLFPKNALCYPERVDLTIDHHSSQQFYARETCLDANRAACGELVLDIVSLLGPVSRDMATALYVAISTDCGCFQYGNTTSDTHRSAAALIDCGIPLAQLNKRHFRTKSLRRMKLEGALISGMELYEQDTVAVVSITRSLMDSLGATTNDIEDIAALVGQVEGVKTAVTLREMDNGQCKLSLRTDPEDLDASRVCALLGGGGHPAASGATMEGSIEQLKQATLAAIRQVKGGA